MARPTRITVLSGNNQTVPVDYFAPNTAIAVYPTTGTATLTYSIDDCSITANPAPIFVALPAPFNVGVAANTIIQLQNFVMRGVNLAMAGGGSAVLVIVQPGEGDAGSGG